MLVLRRARTQAVPRWVFARSLHTAKCEKRQLVPKFGALANVPRPRSGGVHPNRLDVIRTVSLKSWLGGGSGSKSKTSEAPLLAPDDLFHPLEQSPIKAVRDRDFVIKKYGSCPVCVETIPEDRKAQRKQPAFTCPHCGYPTHCSREHYDQDLVEHEKICRYLREANEDEHDLRSGRRMHEFEFPSAQGFDEAINLASWDTFFYTRGFPSMDSPRSIRHVSKLLTYPITIASVLHQSSPLKVGSDLTIEGLRNLSALRTILYPKQEVTSDGVTETRTEKVNIYMLGARAEATLPPHIWLQLAYLFPHTPFHLHFIGPDALPPNTEPYSTTLNDRITFSYSNQLYHDYHRRVTSFDPYTDVYFLFSPGIGHPATRAGWKASLQAALTTKCAIFVTGFDGADVTRDIAALEEDLEGEYDLILKPVDNPFKSEKRDVNLQDLRESAFANWGIWGIRGKRYDVIHE